MLSSDERKELVEELCDALRAFPLHNTHRSVRQMIVHDSIMPIIDRLTTRTHTTADDDAVEAAAKAMCRAATSPMGWAQSTESERDYYRAMARAALAAAPHGDDLDALLNRVHPEANATLRYAIQAVTSDPPDHWEATVRVPVKGYVGFRPYNGTGSTRMAAIADAVARAKGGGDE